MKKLSFILLFCMFIGCVSKHDPMEKIIFLHHSTGYAIWLGKTNHYVYKFTKKGDVQSYIKKFNRKSKRKLHIEERNFPTKEKYGWKNNPFDYYNIWVKNGGESHYMNEPTLELLTKEYGIIILKHCFPVSKILEDTGNPNIDSEERRLENYKLQYEALKKKMHEFPNNKFIVWTPSVSVEQKITPDQAQRTFQFYKWIKDEWNEKGDNIFLWDFYKYETEGGLYIAEKNATSPTDSHPNRQFSERLAPLFAQFIIDVAEGKTE